MININTDIQLEDIRQFYYDAFAHYDPHRKLPAIDIRFYPYIGINHTIRIRNGSIYVRIAEICRDMPEAAHRSLAFILVSKLYRRKLPKGFDLAYRIYSNSEELRLRSLDNKKKFGRKVVNGSAGDVYDLDEIFDLLNERYFRGTLPKPTLTWSSRKTFRILGHHDATHETVVISRSLDTVETPRYVIEYVVFHEMLHIFHPTVHKNGRRYNHTPAFRRDEQKFRYFQQAENWIEQNARKLKKKAKRG